MDIAQPTFVINNTAKIIQVNTSGRKLFQQGQNLQSVLNLFNDYNKNLLSEKIKQCNQEGVEQSIKLIIDHKANEQYDQIDQEEENQVNQEQILEQIGQNVFKQKIIIAKISNFIWNRQKCFLVQFIDESQSNQFLLLNDLKFTNLLNVTQDALQNIETDYQKWHNMVRLFYIKERDLENLSSCVSQLNQFQNFLSTLQNINQSYLCIQSNDFHQYSLKNLIVHAVEVMNVFYGNNLKLISLRFEECFPNTVYGVSKLPNIIFMNILRFIGKDQDQPIELKINCELKDIQNHDFNLKFVFNFSASEEVKLIFQQAYKVFNQKKKFDLQDSAIIKQNIGVIQMMLLFHDIQQNQGVFELNIEEKNIEQEENKNDENNNANNNNNEEEGDRKQKNIYQIDFQFCMMFSGLIDLNSTQSASMQLSPQKGQKGQGEINQVNFQNLNLTFLKNQISSSHFEWRPKSQEVMKPNIEADIPQSDKPTGGLKDPQVRSKQLAGKMKKIAHLDSSNNINYKKNEQYPSQKDIKSPLGRNPQQISNLPSLGRDSLSKSNDQSPKLSQKIPSSFPNSNNNIHSQGNIQQKKEQFMVMKSSASQKEIQKSQQVMKKTKSNNYITEFQDQQYTNKEQEPFNSNSNIMTNNLSTELQSDLKINMDRVKNKMTYELQQILLDLVTEQTNDNTSQFFDPQDINIVMDSQFSNFSSEQDIPLQQSQEYIGNKTNILLQKGMSNVEDFVDEDGEPYTHVRPKIDSAKVFSQTPNYYKNRGGRDMLKKRQCTFNLSNQYAYDQIYGSILSDEVNLSRKKQNVRTWNKKYRKIGALNFQPNNSVLALVSTFENIDILYQAKNDLGQQNKLQQIQVARDFEEAFSCYRSQIDQCQHYTYILVDLTFDQQNLKLVNQIRAVEKKYNITKVFICGFQILQNNQSSSFIKSFPKFTEEEQQQIDYLLKEDSITSQHLLKIVNLTMEKTRL